MVVKELIDKLSKLNPDLLVAFSYDGKRSEVCDPIEGVNSEPVPLHWATNDNGGESLSFEDTDEHGNEPLLVATIYTS